MSPVHGSPGQPFARPVAQNQSQNQWGQPAQPAQGGYAPNGYGAAPAYPPQAQPSAPQQAQPYGGGYGQPNDYQFPQGVPQSGAPQAYGGAAAPARPSASASSYAPQFEPFSPAPQRAQPQPAPQGYGLTPQGLGQGYDYGQSAQAAAYGAQPTPQGNYQQAPQQHAPAAAHAHHQHPQAYQTHAQPQSWGAPHPQADTRGFDLGTYHPAAEPTFGGAAEPSLQSADWSQGGYQHDGGQYGHEHATAEYAQGGDYGAADQGGADLGFGQAAGGELDQGYADDEGQDYEAEAPPRSRRPMMIAAVLTGAIVLGGGMTYGYKALFDGPSGGQPPVVKSVASPSKVKPEAGGGKQFSHADSKIMGRLGDGSAAGAAAEGTDADAGGTRKVATLVVGRDGSIQAPATEPAVGEQPVRVPGMTVVDGLGPARAPAAAATMAATSGASAKAEAAQAQVQAAAQQAEASLDEVAAKAPAAAKKITVAPPAAQKPVTIAKVSPAAGQDQTGSIEAEAPAAAAPPPAAKPKKAKAPAADAASTSVATTGSGFVAVLASVPRSTSSRMDALKRFADMQQKYAGVLTGKTPDVAEANLGAKGNYHRLVVGPPGSREQASTVCSQLKSQGYGDCWVTSY